jgi:hypothetical protein
VLRIFGPTRNKTTWEWTKQHNEELNDLYSPNTIGMTKSRMRWAVHCARMAGAYRVMIGNLREKGQLEDPRLDMRIILRRIFRKCHG